MAESHHHLTFDEGCRIYIPKERRVFERGHREGAGARPGDGMAAAPSERRRAGLPP